MPLSWLFQRRRSTPATTTIAASIVSASNAVVSSVLTSSPAPSYSAPVVIRRSAASDLPVEIVEAILDYLGRPALVQMLAANQILHMLAARRIYHRIGLEFFVPFARIQTLFTTLETRPAYAALVHTFLIDIGAELGAGRGGEVQERVVALFAGGFQGMVNLEVLSLPHRLNEAFAAVMDLHFPRLRRLELRCDVPVAVFLARHASTLTHLVLTHHTVDAEEIPPMPRLELLHAAPALLQHVLAAVRTLPLRRLGVVCSPPLAPAGLPRLEDAAPVVLAPILARATTCCAATLRVLSIREPLGVHYVSEALVDTILPGVTRLELFCQLQTTEGDDPAGCIVRILSSFPSVRALRIGSPFGSGRKLFLDPPGAFVARFAAPAPTLRVVVPDFYYYSRGDGFGEKFKLDQHRFEFTKPWTLITED